MSIRFNLVSYHFFLLTIVRNPLKTMIRFKVPKFDFIDMIFVNRFHKLFYAFN